MTLPFRVLVLIGVICASGILHPYEAQPRNSMVSQPQRYIKIIDFNIYPARGVAIIHHVTIENSSDIAYKNIKVRVRYNSASYPNYGVGVATETGVLPVTLPPHSTKTYLAGGSVLGATSSSFYAQTIEVLGATPIIQ